MIYEKTADRAGHFLFKKYTPQNALAFNPMPHFHNSIELFLVERGEYSVMIGGDRRTLKRGDVAFVDPFILHTSGCVSGCKDFAVYVLVTTNTYYSSEWFEKETLPPFYSSKAAFPALLSLISWGYGMRDGMNDDMRRGFVELLLGTLRTTASVLPRNGVKTGALTADIIRYIGEHYSDDISLSALADRFGYEKTYISRVIGRATGMNLREYLNRLRLAAVDSMRKSMPDEPMYKIVEACGFGSENTYYRCSKKFSQNHNF